MTYQVQFERAALKAIRRIPKDDTQRIVEAAKGLAENPRPNGSSELAGFPGLHRIRVGDYRLIYRIHDNVLTVIVVRIGNRREVYRSLKNI